MNNKRSAFDDLDNDSSLTPQLKVDTPVVQNQKKSSESKKKPANNDPYGVNSAILAELNKDQFDSKIKKVQHEALKATDTEKSSDVLGYFDSSNYNAPQVAPSFDNVPLSELEAKIDDKKPVTKFGKFRKFRLIPTSFFGQVAGFFAVVIVGTIGVNMYQMHQAHLKEVQSISLSQLYTKPNKADTLQLEAMTPTRMNSLLKYMDSRATAAVHETAKNWHTVNYGITHGLMTKDEGLKFLQQNVTVSTSYIQKIQKDKDDLVILYQKSKNNEDVYKVRNIYKVIDSKDPMKKIAEQPTSFETFIFWRNKSISASYYLPPELTTISDSINNKLGGKAKNASNFAAVQMATGVKPQYQNIPKSTPTDSDVNLNSNGPLDIADVLNDRNELINNLTNKIDTLTSNSIEVNKTNQNRLK